MLKQVVFILLLINGYCFYVDDDVFHCEINYSDEELSEYIDIEPIDRFIFLIGAPLAFMCTIFITITFIKYPTTRKMPSDIVLFISLSDCILCIHWFASALYFQIYGQSPISSGLFCQINSLFSIFAGTGEVVYNIVFCIFVRITLKKLFSTIPKLSYWLHSISWLAMITVPTLVYCLNKNGLSLFGTCSFKYTPNFPYAAIFLVFTYVIISIYTIVYFIKTVPDDPKYKEKKEEFAKYYLRYIIASSIIWSIEAICYTIVGLNCETFHKGYLLIFLTIGNASKLCTPFVLSILRYHDPTIKKQIKKIWRKFTNNFSTQVHNRSLNKALVESEENSVEQQNWAEQFKENLKYDLVNTMIYGIRKVCQDEILSVGDSIQNMESEVQFNIERRDTSSNKRINSINPENLQLLQNVYNLTTEDVDEELTYSLDQNSNQNEDGLKILPCLMIAYAPKIFTKIREKDQQMLNIQKSFNQKLNQDQIKKFKGTDGGKGGAFFFFTYDNKFLIKTLTDNELQTFKKVLVPYFLHLQGDSLISPIYGIYRFSRSRNKEQVDEATNILVMRNAVFIPSRYKIRTYDIKGSTYARQVLDPNTQVSEIELRQKTLKDLDFVNLEQKIQIPEQYQEKVRNCLIRDSQFFSSVQLMDYSLLVLKIDWKSYIEETKNVQEQYIQKLFSSDLYCIPSIKEEGIYYHLAIIDYLQVWNVQKMFERKTKQTLKPTKQLDLSAVNPEFYATRFQQKVANALI